jgi:hypothetical protein
MESIVDRLLAAGLPATGSAILVVGAGARSALDTIAALKPARLWLVEGDPEAAEAIEQQGETPPWMTLIASAVAPAEGDLPWRRYSLPALNGPLDQAVLRSFYPRLTQTEMLKRPAVAFRSVLERVLSDVGDERRAMALVLDVPGQEAGLLESVPAELLQCFGWVVVRGCAVRVPGSQDPDAVVSRMQAVGFAPVPAPADEDPLWPSVVWAFDVRSTRERQLRERVDSLEAALAQQRRDTEQIQATHAGQLEDARRLLEQANTQQKRQADMAADARTRLEASEAERAELLVRHQSLQEQLLEAHARQAQLQRDIEDARQAHAGQLDDARRLLDQAQGETKRQAEMAADARAKFDASEALRAQVESERGVMTKEKAALVAARDEQTKLAREARAHASRLDAEIAALSARHGLLQEELVKAEAQIELIADVLLREGQT